MLLLIYVPNSEEAFNKDGFFCKIITLSYYQIITKLLTFQGMATIVIQTFEIHTSFFEVHTQSPKTASSESHKFVVHQLWAVCSFFLTPWKPKGKGEKI